MGFTSSFDSSSFASFLTILPSAAVDASCSCNELELELESPKDPCTEDSTVVDGAGAVTDGSACEGGALRLLLLRVAAFCWRATRRCMISSFTQNSLPHR